MSRPPFTMDKYGSPLELHADAHTYYKEKVEELDGIILKAFFSEDITEARKHLVTSESLLDQITKAVKVNG